MADTKKKKQNTSSSKKKYKKICRKVGMKQSDDGKWIADYRTFYGKTKKEAVEKFEAYKKKRSIGHLSNETCLGVFISWWTENVYLLDGTLKPGTKTLHINSFHNVFDGSEVLGLSISEITGADLQSVFSASRRGATSKRHARSFLRRFYSYLESQNISRNITSCLVIPEDTSRRLNQEVETFSDEEIKLFLNDTPKEHRMRLFIILAIYTGARIGELCALTYDDIADGRIVINKQLCEIDPIITERGKTKIRLEISSTKTKSSVRSLPLEPRDFILKEIDWHRKWHTEEMARNGYSTNYVFTAANGELYYKSNLRTAYRRLCKSIGVRHKSIHVFRHTFGSKLAKSGVPIQDVSKLMGHDSIAVTAKYYINVDDDTKRAALKRLSFE